jgi:hypothetical protein
MVPGDDVGAMWVFHGSVIRRIILDRILIADHSINEAALAIWVQWCRATWRVVAAAVQSNIEACLAIKRDGRVAQRTQASAPLCSRIGYGSTIRSKFHSLTRRGGL